MEILEKFRPDYAKVRYRVSDEVLWNAKSVLLFCSQAVDTISRLSVVPAAFGTMFGNTGTGRVSSRQSTNKSPQKRLENSSTLVSFDCGFCCHTSFTDTGMLYSTMPFSVSKVYGTYVFISSCEFQFYFSTGNVSFWFSLHVKSSVSEWRCSLLSVYSKLGQRWRVAAGRQPAWNLGHNTVRVTVHCGDFNARLSHPTV